MVGKLEVFHWSFATRILFGMSAAMFEYLSSHGLRAFGGLTGLTFLMGQVASVP